ncbi:MAG TPA: transcriptional regulator, partial [Gammaproteobacteria bacterium]|nr:transcriptional regulator [Gammaproteobacteria bacterium]
MDHTQINAQLNPLLATLKRMLRERGITYRELASGLGVSEATIKRAFSTASFSLQRLLQICDYADLTLAELAQSAETPVVADELT